jgi:TonB family protein
MSFSITKKNTRRAIGIVSALCITGIMTFGFLQSYQQAKQRQVHQVNLVEVTIFADKPAADAILYEVVPTEECIKQLTADTSLAIPVGEKSLSLITSSVSSQASSTPLQAIASTTGKAKAAINVKTPAPVAIKRISPPEPRLIFAKSPKCVARSTTPMGYEKLGAEGYVGLELNLAKTGRVERGEVEKSSGFTELDAAALLQVKNTWQFEPCTKAGKVVGCKHRIRFRWSII